jgi:hypothetical protein
MDFTWDDGVAHWLSVGALVGHWRPGIFDWSQKGFRGLRMGHIHVLFFISAEA